MKIWLLQEHNNNSTFPQFALKLISKFHYTQTKARLNVSRHESVFTLALEFQVNTPFTVSKYLCSWLSWRPPTTYLAIITLIISLPWVGDSLQSDYLLPLYRFYKFDMRRKERKFFKHVVVYFFKLT